MSIFGWGFLVCSFRIPDSEQLFGLPMLRSMVRIGNPMLVFVMSRCTSIYLDCVRRFQWKWVLHIDVFYVAKGTHLCGRSFVLEICFCLWFYKVREQVTCVPSWIGICGVGAPLGMIRP
jgi:hypothetical protein